MIKKNKLKDKRYKRKIGIRKKISGTPQKPRLSVFKSLKYVYAQLIDDVNGVTIVSASSLEKEIKSDATSNKNIEVAKKVGSLIAERAMSKGINEVVFDRNGFRFHGKIKALADAAREKGLKF